MQIGEVKSILQGDFISTQRPNWLVFANSKVALCSITNQVKTVCSPVIKGDDYLNYKFEFQSGALKISPSDDARMSSSERTKDFSSTFASALNEASKKLRLKIDLAALATIEKPPQVTAKTKTKGKVEDSMSPMASNDEDMPIDWEDNPGGGGSAGGWGGGGSGTGNGGCNPVFCIVPIPPPPITPVTIPDPWDLSLPDLGTPIRSLCERIGFCSSDEEKRLEAEEAQRCDAEYNWCLADCSIRVLQTPTGNDGWNHVKCVSTCMRTTGCKGWNL